MSKFRMPKINSVHFGATWIGSAIVIGGVLPAVIWMLTDVFYWGFSVIGGILLFGFIIVFCIEMKQDSDRNPYYKQYLSEDIPYDPDKQIAVIKCSICNGEQVAGFKSKENGHFTEVMLIREPADLAEFKKIYRIEEIKKEY